MRKILLTLVLSLFAASSFADDIWIFTASWCTPCKNLKSFLKDYHKVLKSKGHRLTLIDIDKDPELKKSYRVSNVPTTIVFDDNKDEKGRLEGFNEKFWPAWIQDKTR